jgi:lipid-A-disaccharide synthase
LCREFVVPELLQEAATPRAMANEVLRWLDAPTKAPDTLAVLERKFQKLHRDLQRDTATIATDAIQKVLQN